MNILLRWHEAMTVFEPELLVTSFEWDETAAPGTPYSIEWTRVIDAAPFGWSPMPSRVHGWKDNHFRLARQPKPMMLHGGISVEQVVRNPPIVTLSLIFLHMNDRFPVARPIVVPSTSC